MRFQDLAGPIGWQLLANIYWMWANWMVAFMNIYEFLDIAEGKSPGGGAAVSSSISKSVWEGQWISCYLSYLLALIRKSLANLMKLYFLIIFWYLQLGKRPSVHLVHLQRSLKPLLSIPTASAWTCGSVEFSCTAAGRLNAIPCFVWANEKEKSTFLSLQLWTGGPRKTVQLGCFGGKRLMKGNKSPTFS